MRTEAEFDKYIDLRGISCPLNFVKCRLALEKLTSNQLLQVDLDRGEPELMVIPGLQKDGHSVEILKNNSSWITLRVVCDGG